MTVRQGDLGGLAGVLDLTNRARAGDRVDTIGRRVDIGDLMDRVHHHRNDLLFPKPHEDAEVVAVARDDAGVGDRGRVDLAVAVVVLNELERFFDADPGNEHGAEPVVHEAVLDVDPAAVVALGLEALHEHFTAAQIGQGAVALPGRKMVEVQEGAARFGLVEDPTLGERRVLLEGLDRMRLEVTGRRHRRRRNSRGGAK